MLKYLEQLKANQPMMNKYKKAMKLLDEIHMDAVMFEGNQVSVILKKEENHIENSVRLGWQECWSFFRNIQEDVVVIEEKEVEEMKKFTNILKSQGLTDEEIKEAIKREMNGESND